jgi:hypothetical protein
MVFLALLKYLHVGSSGTITPYNHSLRSLFWQIFETKVVGISDDELQATRIASSDMALPGLMVAGSLWRSGPHCSSISMHFAQLTAKSILST